MCKMKKNSKFNSVEIFWEYTGSGEVEKEREKASQCCQVAFPGSGHVLQGLGGSRAVILDIKVHSRGRD